MNLRLESIPVYGNAVDLGQKVSISCTRQLILWRKLGDTTCKH